MFYNRLSMKMRFLNIIFLQTCWLPALWAQPNLKDGNGIPSGQWAHKDSDGKILSKGLYKEGKREGEWRFYLSPIGRYASEPDIVGMYENGVKNGDWQYTDSRTKVLLKGKFANDQMQGVWTFYDNKGRKLAQGEYTDGIRNGHWTLFRNNAPMANGYYENGLRAQSWKFDYYLDDSTVHIVGAFDYSGGGRTGNFEHFKVVRHPKFPREETLVGKGAYQNGRKTGRWIEYTPGLRGEMIETGYYDGEGRRTGVWHTTVDGRMFQECGYNDGLKQGQFKSYNENGTTKYISSYENGLEHGYFTAYYDNGKVREKGAYTLLEQEATGDTTYYKIELPYEFNFRLVDLDFEKFNYNAIKWIADMDYSIAGDELNRRWEEALQYGQSRTLRIADVARTQKQVVRVGEYKSFYENGQVKLEGSYYPTLKVTTTNGSTTREFARDGEWKEYDETSHLRKIYTYQQGELLKVTDGNGAELDKINNQNN